MGCAAMGSPLNLEALAATQLPRHSLSLKPSRLSFNAKGSGFLRRILPVRSCLPAASSGDTRADESVEKGNASSDEKKKLSSQSSWEATDVLGDDYLYRLGKESDNLNITVGAKTGMVDSLFTGNFLGQEGESHSASPGKIFATITSS
jgi:hypothetical protein